MPKTKLKSTAKTVKSKSGKGKSAKGKATTGKATKGKAGIGNADLDLELIEPEEPELSPQELKALQIKARKERQAIIAYVGKVAAVAILLGLVIAAVAGPKLAVAAVGGIMIFSLCSKYPRTAFWAMMIYMPFGGTVTYSFGAGGGSFLQLANDAFYIPGLIGIVQYCRRERLPLMTPKPLVPFVSILFSVALLTLIFVNGAQQFRDPGSDKPLLMGILGLKVLMGFLPLIVCAYYLLRNRKEFLFFMRLLLILAIVCCALGFIQYLMLKTGRCKGTVATGDALFKASLDSRCLVGGALLYAPDQGVIRLPGTFNAPWQWGWFLIANAFTTFATAFSDPKPQWRLVGLGGMAMVMVMAVISGQRIALALVPLVFVILLFLTGQVTNLKRFIPIGVGLGLILVVAASMYPEIVQERIASFSSRWEASPPDSFIRHQFEWAIERTEGYFLGRGLGRATNSARIFGQTSLVETYYPKLLFELGPLGLIAMLVVLLMVTWVTFRAYRSLRDRNLRSYAASLWVFLLFISFNTYYYPLDVEPVNIYYWFFAGVILKLPEIERQERKALREGTDPDAIEPSSTNGKGKKSKKSQKSAVAAT